MPEIKHTFTAGKMNKDLDERLVPNGEYRDALNIQVRTTDGDANGIGAAGTVQNVKGNKDIAKAYKTEGYDTSSADNTNVTKFVGSVGDEKKDKAYFFAAAPVPASGIENIPYTNIMNATEIINAGEDNEEEIPRKVTWVDSIIEVDTINEEGKPIFVDAFAITCQFGHIFGGLGDITLNESLLPEVDDLPFTQLNIPIGSSISFSEIRIGMIMYLQDDLGNHLLFSSDGSVGVEIVDIIELNPDPPIDNNGNVALGNPTTEAVITLANEQDVNILDSIQNGDLSINSAIKLVHPERVLEFNYNTKNITGINIIDDLLFWTDRVNEPKKINIIRSNAGTNINNVANDGKTHTQLYVKNPDIDDLVPIEDIEYLPTSDIKREHITVIRKAPISSPTLIMKSTDRESDINFTIDYNFINLDIEPAIPEQGVERILTISEDLDIRINDLLTFTSADPNDAANPTKLTARVINIDGDQVTVVMMFIDENLTIQVPETWSVRIEQEKALFETKFGRVGYRYKYEDGEYSSFAPWSELAFLPKNFSYTPSKGFNEGMANSVRQLIIRDFIPDDSIRPSDVKQVDILWKTTDDASVYIIKSITRERDTEWRNFDQNNEFDEVNTGVLTITSEMIHRVIEENQLLRGWDNVPRNAIAQEITGNRLVYGNYTQGYNIDKVVGLKQSLVSDIVPLFTPKKSVKSIRSYKFGMVFGDVYGRETPVVANGYQLVEGEQITGDISVEKSLAQYSNKFKLQQDWEGEDGPENWMSYVKYYVKETSSEYYNLVLDRWYDAGDDCIWLAFPSVDRNKIDEETYLILKNEHGAQNVVTEEARYKVLAIENEAPDYIKTNYRYFERIEIDRAGIYDQDETNNANNTGVTDAIPIGIFGKTFISTSAGNWIPVGNNGGNIQLEDFKGKSPKVRIVGVFGNIEVYSPWKNISRIKPLQGWESTSRPGVSIESEWTEAEVNMYNRINPLTDTTIVQQNVDFVGDSSYISYYFEFRDEVVENLPQFDGRFFVKIEKDNILSEKVLNETQGDYDILDTYEITYITNKAENDAENGIYAGAPWPTTVGFTSDNIENTVQSQQLTGNALNYELFWNNDILPGAGAGFIHTPSQGPPNWGPTLSWPLGDVDPLPNFGPGNPDETQLFWEYWKEQGEGNNPRRKTNIFIDACPAYSGFEFHVANLPGIIHRELGKMDSENLSGQPQPISYHTNFQYQEYFDIGTYGNNEDQEEAKLWGFHKAFWRTHQIGNRFSNWMPPGLSRGLAFNGELGQITFSTIKSGASGFAPGDDSDFKSYMQTPGTLFRFQNDPYGKVYRTIGFKEVFDSTTYDPDPDSPEGYNDNNLQVVPVSTDQNALTYEGNVEIGGQVVGGNAQNWVYNFKTQTTGEPPSAIYPGDPALRFSIIIRFERIDDSDGNPIPNSGIQVDQWDPRGQVYHNGLADNDGLGGSFTIEILSDTVGGELIEDAIESDSSCWETEPKKSADIDIYYEASDALPMKLQDDNIQLYTSPNAKSNLASKFILKNRKLTATDNNGNAIIENIDIPNGAWVQRVLGSDAIRAVYGNDSNPTPLETVVNGFNTQGVAIGDEISFKHPNGLVTRTKVLDHYNSTSHGLGNIDVPILSNRVYLENMAVINYGGTGCFYDMLTQEPIPGAEVGMEVIGDGIEKGTFIAQIGVWTFFNGAPYFYDMIYALNKEIATIGIYNFTLIKPTGWFKIDQDVWQYPVDLSWFNCYSFGNAVESDRIRDDFNAPQIDNGVKVSSTFLEYGEERIGSGLIHSGLYNSTSSVNELNQFNMAEKITKNLNPAYGSVQALKTRDTDLVVLAEDKILKVLANKDAVYNADGNMQLTATNRVLGQSIPFIGDYGISKNPESLAWDQFRIYFTDAQRGAVLRLSRDGLTPISNVGMKTYFRENLRMCDNAIGTFDIVNGEYNLTLDIKNEWQIDPMTITFNEGGKGWVSFKSFIPSCGVSVAGKYLTAPSNFHEGFDDTPNPINKIWLHNDNTVNRNKFYDKNNKSEIEILFNDSPGSIKSFKSVNYEGSQARISEFTTQSIEDATGTVVDSINTDGDGEYYNLSGKSGWYVSQLSTDLQEAKVPEFIDKENKWFNYITGFTTTLNNLDESEFSVQGIGFPLINPAEPASVSPPEAETDADIEIEENENTDTDGETTVADPLVVTGTVLASSTSISLNLEYTGGSSPTFILTYWDSPDVLINGIANQISGGIGYINNNTENLQQGNYLIAVIDDWSAYDTNTVNPSTNVTWSITTSVAVPPIGTTVVDEFNVTGNYAQQIYIGAQF